MVAAAMVDRISVAILKLEYASTTSNHMESQNGLAKSFSLGCYRVGEETRSFLGFTWHDSHFVPDSGCPPTSRPRSMRVSHGVSALPRGRAEHGGLSRVSEAGRAWSRAAQKEEEMAACNNSSEQQEAMPEQYGKFYDNPEVASTVSVACLGHADRRAAADFFRDALARGASHRHLELTALVPSSPTACCYTSSRDRTHITHLLKFKLAKDYSEDLTISFILLFCSFIHFRSSQRKQISAELRYNNKIRVSYGILFMTSGGLFDPYRTESIPKPEDV
ncbi:Protein of unknown function [Gryllus bimaculatus]|nr:Protein of unknown function [Gryllus bimaculatus]